LETNCCGLVFGSPPSTPIENSTTTNSGDQWVLLAKQKDFWKTKSCDTKSQYHNLGFLYTCSLHFTKGEFKFKLNFTRTIKMCSMLFSCSTCK
jgi:hypothetical protein